MPYRLASIKVFLWTQRYLSTIASFQSSRERQLKMVADGGGAKQCFIDLAKADTSRDFEKALRIANKGHFLDRSGLNIKKYFNDRNYLDRTEKYTRS